MTSHEQKVFKALISAGFVKVNGGKDGHHGRYECLLDGEPLSRRKSDDYIHGPKHFKEEHDSLWFWFNLFLKSTGDWIPSSVRMEGLL